MKKGAFIQSNKKQILGAKVAKFALETRGGLKKLGIPVTIMEVETIPAFRAFEGKPYRKGYAPFSLGGDLQSFTMTRFMPPEMMGYEGRALVIDPDIFALADMGQFFALDMGGAAVLACTKRPWDTSVMLLDCEKLRHWNVEKMLADIASGEKTYEDIIALRTETVGVNELSRVWNNLDTLTPETKMLHTTGRLTQPWKTGLPIDFTPNTMPKYFGLIPREPIHKLLGKYQTHYQQHPNKEIEKLFFDLLREAHEAGAVSEEEIQENIEQKNIRGDIFAMLR